MALKILHTADWHLGQKFYEYDRTEEHQKFLSWLIELLESEGVDVLLVAGDIFDVANPSSASQRLFYDFLYSATQRIKGLQIILTAGNHDSPSRLEAPSSWMELFDISIIGSVRKVENEIDWESLIIPLKDRATKSVQGYCMAVPYLRNGDYGNIGGDTSNYTNNIYSFYHELYKQVSDKNDAKLPVVAMGHLFVSGSEISDSEKGIRGGLEIVSPDTFHEEIFYVALGHIHRAQKIAGLEYIRYSGTPIPMSFSEVDYKHQVVVVELEKGQRTIHTHEIPLTTSLIRVGTPSHPIVKDELMDKLNSLPDKDLSTFSTAPYLEINVLLDAPDLTINQEIKEILDSKHMRLARNVAHYPKSNNAQAYQVNSLDELRQLSPSEMFERHYLGKYNSEIPSEIKTIFNEVLQEIDPV